MSVHTGCATLTRQGARSPHACSRSEHRARPHKQSCMVPCVQHRCRPTPRRTRVRHACSRGWRPPTHCATLSPKQLPLHIHFFANMALRSYSSNHSTCAVDTRSPLRLWELPPAHMHVQPVATGDTNRPSPTHCHAATGTNPEVSPDSPNWAPQPSLSQTEDRRSSGRPY